MQYLACSELANTYSSLYTAVTSPGNHRHGLSQLSSPSLVSGNGYQPGVLSKTPEQVNKLLQL